MIKSKKSVILTLNSAMMAGIYGMSLLSYLPRYLLQLKVDITIIQLLITCLVFTTVIFPPLLGKLSDKIQRRSPFIKMASIGMNFTLFLFLFAINLTMIIILIFFYGFFWVSDGMKFVLYSEFVESNHRYIAYYNAILAFGWFLGTFGGGIVIDIFGFEGFFRFLLIMSLINTVIVIFLKENRSLILEQQETRDNENNNNLNIIEQKEIKKEISPISRSIYTSLFFRNFGVRPIFAILAIIMFYYISSDTEIGFLIGINYLIQVFLNLLIGRIITDRNLKWFMFIGYILSAIAIFGWIMATDFWSFLFFIYEYQFSARDIYGRSIFYTITFYIF
ncbi:MAG: MFS transporter [Promethearchaeota archaeon]